MRKPKSNVSVPGTRRRRSPCVASPGRVFSPASPQHGDNASPPGRRSNKEAARRAVGRATQGERSSQRAVEDHRGDIGPSAVVSSTSAGSPLRRNHPASIQLCGRVVPCSGFSPDGRRQNSWSPGNAGKILSPAPPPESWGAGYAAFVRRQARLRAWPEQARNLRRGASHVAHSFVDGAIDHRLHRPARPDTSAARKVAGGASQS